MGSTKKGSNKKGSRTQQASSSSSSSAGASSRALKQHQGSRVHPYHLQVLSAAGVAPERFDIYAEHLSVIVAADGLPTYMFTLYVVLRELEKQQTGQTQDAAAGLDISSTGTGISSAAGASISSGGTTSSSSSSSNQGPSAGGPAAVLALLPLCSLMWGEFQALQCTPAAAAASLVPVEVVVSGLWYTSFAIHTAASKHPAAMQRDPQGFDAGLRRTIDHGVQTLLSADSWYRSCVELIMPSLLPMGAVGAINPERYRSAAGECSRG
jgi:hypothetical protein